MSETVQKCETPPFHMIGDIYFIGGPEVSVHLIDTGAGLIMIDTGYPFMRERIVENMRALGFDPADVRILLHSHGHYDHIGSTMAFRECSGAKTCISRIDNAIVNGTLDLSWASELGYPRLEPFECDVLLEDGDFVELGHTQILCRLAPGHTAGTMCFFFETREAGKRYVVAMHGGLGENSMTAEFLNRHGLEFGCRECFRMGLHRLAELPVDVVLGNHPDQNDTEGKRKRIMAGERLACVDSGEWRRLMREAEARLDRMIAAESLNKREG